MADSDCFERIEGAFRAAAEILDRAGVQFMLGGSLAAWVRGGPESCNDLDLMIRPADVNRALEAFERAGAKTERPPEGWLVKAWIDDVLIDLIHAPSGVPMDDAAFERGDDANPWAIPARAMALEDVLVSKLLSLGEHHLDFEAPLQIARAVREQVDWNRVRERTAESPYARGFIALLEELGVLERDKEHAAPSQPRIRVATAGG
jgi:hypothetical protein